MPKSATSDNKDAKEKLTEMVKNNPKQIEKEIFTDIDAQGFNQNSSAQQEYPGIQKHKPTRNKAK